MNRLLFRPSPRMLVLLAATCLASAALQAAPAVTAPGAPKLVVVLVVDGLPNEQVQRYRAQFGQGGFRRLLDNGAWYGDAHQAHGITVTAIGHAAILTGAYPYQHGIIGNNWIDQASGASVYCTDDTSNTYIGEETKADDGTSPRRLRVNTLGDELRYSNGNLSKVVTVSGKDRGAILLGGKTGTAYMYMEKSGNFASSTYYMAQHPAWATSFNAKKPADRYYGKTWRPLLDDAAYAGDANEDLVPLKKDVQARFPFSYYSESGKPDADYYKRLKTSPALDELTLEFAQAAVEGENLGRNPAGVTDILGVSMSAHDYVNHTYGPESKMSHDHLQRLDRMLANFFGFLDQRVGLDNVVVVLTADHGFANVPEFSKTRHLDSDRLDGDKLAADLDQHLASTLGVAKLVKKPSIPNFYLDYEAAAKANIGRAALEDAAARFLLQQNGVADVFTRTQMENGVVATRTAKLMRRGWNRQMSGDLMVVAKPFWIFSTEKTGTTHGSPYAYDTNVPLILMGKRWIKPGSYGQYAEVVDIVPTLGHLLRVRPPAAAEGRVLTETLR
jgi:predicted AlkP superfamily pyrophosphatase or phosphodiesterase